MFFGQKTVVDSLRVTNRGQLLGNCETAESIAVLFRITEVDFGESGRDAVITVEAGNFFD